MQAWYELKQNCLAIELRALQNALQFCGLDQFVERPTQAPHLSYSWPNGAHQNDLGLPLSPFSTMLLWAG
jgi:hypothetical protein